MKLFRIDVGKEEFFKKYLLVVNSILRLSEQQMNIFAYFLYLNDKHKDLPREERSLLVFNPKTKHELQKKLGISKQSLENYMTKLRKKGFITDKSINPTFEIFYDTHKDLGFLFRIKEDEPNDR